MRTLWTAMAMLWAMVTILLPTLLVHHMLTFGQRVKLTQVEYAIVKMFMENPGKALSREEILDLVWGHDYFGELKIVDVNIRRLRLKIEDNATNPTYITTIWGFGYKWGL